MAECEYCGKEMRGNSCDRVMFEFEEGTRETLAPVKFGDEESFKNNGCIRTCPDCGCPRGGYHHVGCDVEECPRCHGQAISCSCKIVIE